MIAGKRIFRSVINAAIFIVLEVAALNMLNNNGTLQNFFISKYTHGFMSKAWGFSESVKYYFSLSRVNKELSEENFALMQQIRKHYALEERLKMDSLSFAAREFNSSFKYSPASIVKVSRNKQHNYIILGQGSEDGVTPHSGIITSNGVIGIVDAVSRHYSYAISFMNTEMQISTRLGKEGAVGPLVWDGKSTDGAILNEIPLQHKFSPGDTVYTSGYSSIFPAGIPLGTTGESRIVNGATYEIKIRLFQDFNALKYVTLVENTGAEEIRRLEEQDN